MLQSWQSFRSRILVIAAMTGIAISGNFFQIGLGLANASDWPEWGGPERSGVASDRNLIDGWPESQPPIRWRIKLGQGYSSFAIRDGKAFTQYQDLFGQYLTCLNLATGDTIWNHRYDIPYETAGIYPGPRSTPAIVGDRVLFIAPNGVLGCVDRKDGQPIWSVPFKQRYQGRGTEFGDSAAVRVFDDIVVVPVGGPGATLVGFDVNTGREVWKTGELPASYAPVQPISLDGRNCGLAFLQNSLLVVDLKTGERVWEKELSTGYDEHAAIPLIEGDSFLLASPFRAGATKYRILPVPSPDAAQSSSIQVKTLWDIAYLSNDTASSVLWRGAVYGFDLRDPQAKAHRPSKGEFRCVDWETGKKLWSSDQVGHATVLVADEKLILFNDRGELILAKAGISEYHELARTQVFDDEICWTAPALAEGQLLLRSHVHAACIDLRKPDGNGSAGAESIDQLTAAPLAKRWSVSLKSVLDLLLHGEREHPLMRPELFELQGWFYWSLMLSVAPGCLLAWTVTRRLRTKVLFKPQTPKLNDTTVALPKVGDHLISFDSDFSHTRLDTASSIASDIEQVPNRDLFWRHFPATVCGCACMMVGGLFGGMIANRISENFIFTWPAALFGMLLLTIDLALRFQSTKLTIRGEIVARALVLGLAGGSSLSYFVALRWLSLPHEWVYLIGLLPVTPVLWCLARNWQKQGWTIWNSLGTLLAYALFFWICTGMQFFLTWRERLGMMP